VTKKVFVGGLRDTTDEAGLNAYFSQFGKVDHIDMIEDRTTKRMRGFAYVSFLDYDPVDKAVCTYHIHHVSSSKIKKYISLIESCQTHNTQMSIMSNARCKRTIKQTHDDKHNTKHDGS